MSEYLTMDEIKARYAPETVVITDPQRDEEDQILGGRVVFHSPDRDKCWEAARELGPERFFIEYLGEYPEALAVNLMADGHLAFIEEIQVDTTMTMEGIRARYAPDWVLIVDPQTDEMQRVLGGKVIFHSPDRTAVWEKVGELKIDRVAVRFLGEYPEHMVFGL